MPELPFAVAGRTVIALRARDVFAKQDDVLNMDDPDRVHDMRVATRRLRAALEVFAVCFEPKRCRRARRDVKRLADALGDRRDCDVLNGILEQLTEIPDAVEAIAVNCLISELRRDQRKANRRLRSALARAAGKRLEHRLERLSI
jgi:CHAD domain-containing protein